MAQEELDRRRFVEAALLAAGAPFLAVTGAAAVEPQAQESPRRRLKVAVVGGHPDDPESGCAGTLARYAEGGHDAAIVYLTRGERGIRGKELAEAAAIRTAECEAAAKLLGARPLFAGQIDGAAEATRPRAEELQKLLAAEAPDVLFTHWPLDTHFDHQVAALLAFQAYQALPRKPLLCLFEVNTGSQSQGFAPNVYVDITATVEKKKAALAAHKSQDGEGIWRAHHEPIAAFRGREAGVKWAEAFFALGRGPAPGRLPGL